MKFSSSVALATFQVLNSNMCLMATVLDSIDIGHFHHCKSSFRYLWSKLIYICLQYHILNLKPQHPQKSLENIIL